jgi:glycosyltransferase involved in cell wall biosynthesis
MASPRTPDPVAGSSTWRGADGVRPLDNPATGPLLDPAIPILIYADEWGGVGGTAGYVIMLGRGLGRRGFRVAAICSDTDDVASMRAQLTQAGVEVRTIGGGDRSFGSRLARHSRLTSIVRAYPGCTLALMMGYFTRGGGVTLAGAMGGAAAIVRADLTPPEPPITWRQSLALRLKDRLTDRIVVGAVENREAFARLMGRDAAKIDVIHTGIELGRFQPGADRAAVRAEFGYSDREIVIGTTSRLDDERKGVSYFVEMAARVAPGYPEARFLIVGDGVLRPGLEARVDELGIRDRVAFGGWRSDIPRVLAGLDIFVMQSLFEGGPTSVLEAMAMALPVVATRVGMVPEVIAEDRSGLVVEPASAPALTEAVSRLLADRALRQRLGEMARADASRTLSIDLMVERYLRVFERARLERARRARSRESSARE